MKNRILAGISKYQEIVKIKNIPADKLETLSANLNMPLDEYCIFQELKSAYVGSMLTLDESTTIYGFLGNVPEHFNNQPVEVKAVLTNVFRSLLSYKIDTKQKIIS
jgi:hypothetical protein